MAVEPLRIRLRGELERLRAPEGYLRAGWPRYNTLFGRDSLIAAWQTLRTDPSIARATLATLAKHQGRTIDLPSEQEPGKILHEYRFDPASQAEVPGWSFPYYGSVDSTLLFLIVAGAYLDATQDRGFVSALWPSLASAHDWIELHGDKDRDGFVEYARQNPSALFHQGWKDGSEDHLRIRPPVALVEVQGYAFAAHRAFAKVAESVGRGQEARKARKTEETLQQRFNRAFWWPEEATFYLALDGGKEPRTAVTSNPGHLLFTGIVDEEKRPGVVRRLFRDDLWTPYGIRTHATSEPDFDSEGYHLGTVWPHDNWFIWRGLQALGLRREADRIRDAMLRAYGELGRIPELYAVVDDRIVDLSGERLGTTANPIQAGSLGTLIDMLGANDPV